MQGFIANDAVVTGIDTAYDLTKKILLHEDSAIDPRSRAMPQSCYVSHLEIQLLQTSGTSADVSAFLTWNEEGNEPMTGESASTALWTGLTTIDPGGGAVNVLGTAIALDVWATAPDGPDAVTTDGQTAAGKCYLHIKVNSGVVVLRRARLHWSDRANV